MGTNQRECNLIFLICGVSIMVIQWVVAPFIQVQLLDFTPKDICSKFFIYKYLIWD